MSQTIQRTKKPSTGPRKADTYRANRKSVPRAVRTCPLPIIGYGRQQVRGKSWPNPVNPIQEAGEAARRLRHRHATGAF